MNNINILEEKLDNTSYRNNFYATVIEVEHLAAIRVNLHMDVECAYNRDGKKVTIMRPVLIPYVKIDSIITNFNIWIREQIRKLEHHEIDEWLLINDRRVFDPHKKEKHE